MTIGVESSKGMSCVHTTSVRARATARFIEYGNTSKHDY